MDEKKTPWVVDVSSFSDIRHEAGRPDLFQASFMAPSHWDFLVCGPTTLARGVRSALRSSDVAGPMGVLRGKPIVDLHVETFGW
jgi:ferredoxin-NADP reductase